MAAMEDEKKMITLTSSDGVDFEVDEAVARESQTISRMIENGCADNSSIPLPNVNSKILSRVIEYCNKHVQVQPADPNSSASAAAAALAYYTDELKKWDADFVRIDQATLFELILAANYLDIKGLPVLVCQTFVNEIKAAQIREENQ